MFFSALGFYPVTPATDEYVLGAPLFKKAVLNLSNGKKVVIQADNNSDANKYVNSLQWNGKAYTKNFVKHSDLIQGATLRFDMQAKPNTSRGTAVGDLPFSLSKDDK